MTNDTLYGVNQIYTRPWLKADELAEVDMADLKREMEKRWRRFLQEDLPEICAAVSAVIEVVPKTSDGDVFLDVR
jgi:hypothetical protein